jgi:spore coat polysaccharide biosynthesis protein SpsF (cytidylyltransferase family)
MATVAIIQQRFGNTRLPGKGAMLINDFPLTWHVINRVKMARKVDAVVLAVPNEGEHTRIWAHIAAAHNVPIFIYGGNPNDLVARYVAASKIIQDTKTVVRVPADNPCVDPREIDHIIDYYEQLPKPVGMWLTTNLDQDVLGNGYPGGLGAEVYDPWFLHWLHANVEEPELREHPHKWAFKHARIHTVLATKDLRAPELKFSVDTQADLDFIRAIYPNDFTFSAKEIICRAKTHFNMANKSDSPSQA